MDTAVKVVLIAGLATLFIFNFFQKESFAYVDSQKILNGYKGMQVAVAEYKAKVASWSKSLEVLRSEINQLRASVKDAKGSGKQMVEGVIRSKEVEFQEYEKAVKDKALEEDKVLTKAVTDKVNDFLQRYGEKMNYSIILGTTQTGNIVYAKDGLDITEEVIKGLNEEYGH